jgi:hypothetical protein
MARMMLLTKTNRKALPKLYSQENKGDDALAVVKFFDPISQWTWYATEFDGDNTFFGLVKGNDPQPELGYFLLSELENFKGKWHLGIERDRHFTPTKIGDLR